MSFTTLPSTPLQIFGQAMLQSLIIFKGGLYPDKNVNHQMRNQQILLSSLDDTTPSPVFDERCDLRMVVSNLLYNVNKYKNSHWSLSPSAVTMRLDSERPGVSRLHYRPNGNWSVATYPCYLHLRSRQQFFVINHVADV